MKVIQDISKKKANKNAFVPFQVCLSFLSEALPHTIQTGNLAFMGLDKSYPNWATLYNLKKS